jgi:hypothetical protein
VLAVVTLSGLCRVLIDQGFPSSKKASLALDDDFLPYKAASLKGFADLVENLAESETSKLQTKYLYELVAPRLIAVVDADNVFGYMDTTESSHAPVLVARTIDCLAATLWDGIGSSSDADTVMKLAALFKVASGKKQPAWSVREAATLGAARLASKCDLDALRRSEAVLILMECTKQSLADRKFWRVRCVMCTPNAELYKHCQSHSHAHRSISYPQVVWTQDNSRSSQSNSGVHDAQSFVVWHYPTNSGFPRQTTCARGHVAVQGRFFEAVTVRFD